MPAEEILRHMQNKEVGGVESVQGEIIGKSYHIMDIKETDYMIINDDNLWDIGAFGGFQHTSEVHGSWWGVGNQTFKLS